MVEKNVKKNGRPAVILGEGLPMMIMRDSESKTVLSTVIPAKGECEYAIRKARHDVNNILGYKKMIFKSDQEASLGVMLDRVST